MATHRSNILIVVFMLLLGFMVIQKGDGIGYLPRKRYYVVMENGATSSITTHCKFKKDDLQQRVLKPGESYEWSFKINFLGSTLYMCEVWHDKSYKRYPAFNASDDPFVMNYCGYERCHWKPNNKGITVFNAKKGDWEMIYKW